MNYRSVAQLSDQVAAWSRALPKDLDLIVGVPRSGMLVANLLAIYRNLPFADVEGLREGRIIATGRRYQGHLRRRDPARALNVLVVDDSVWGGKTMRRVKGQICAAALPHRIRYGAVYVRPGSEEVVDFYCEPLDVPRAFEWNIMHHKLLSESCMDFEGVLYEDGPDAQGAGFPERLDQVEPAILPSESLGWLVTWRAEEHRRVIEEWLARHGVEYRELVMVNLPATTGATRRNGDAYSELKAQVYQKTQGVLFYEQSLPGATRIAELAGKPVFCVGAMQMVYPGTAPQARYTTPGLSTTAWMRSLVRRRLGQWRKQSIRFARGLLANLRARSKAGD